MNTIGDLVAGRSRDDQNNFTILRVVAASMVVYGHAFALAKPTGQLDLVTRLTGYRYSGDLGVHIFFTISGFLVFASYANRGDLFHFLKSRALRLFPALLVSLALVTFVVGPILSPLSLAEYVRSPQVWRYFLWNGSLYQNAADLPGVFAGQRMSAVNGNLWTLPIEARLYVLLALFGALGFVTRRRWANVAIGALVFVGLFCPERILIIGENPHHLRLGVFFAVGAFLYNNRADFPLDGRALVMLLAGAVLSWRTPNFDLFGGAAVAYGSIYLAYRGKLKLPSFIRDYSYGIYVYSWPIEQILAHFWPDIRPYPMAAAALFLSWAMGALSWFVIESPALALKNVKLGFRRAPTPEGEPA